MKVFKHAHESILNFSRMLDNFEQKRPSLFEVDMQKFSRKLMEKYESIFKWHARDTVNNFSSSKSFSPEAITYYKRFYKYFGINQVE